MLHKIKFVLVRLFLKKKNGELFCLFLWPQQPNLCCTQFVCLISDPSVSAISTSTLNKITPLKLPLAIRSAHPGIINSP